MPTYLVKLDVGDSLVGSSYPQEMELHERLRFGRQRAKLTQQQVADHFKIARVSVTQWEGNTSRPDQNKFTELAGLYDVPLAWLMDGRGEAPSTNGTATPAPTVQSAKFIRARAFRFYVKEWREFMGVKADVAAKAAGLDEDEYDLHENYPINFNLAQIVSLANEIGVRGDQFWFPPPARPVKASRPTKPTPRAVRFPGRK